MNITAKALGPYQTNCYIIEQNGSSLIIDPGVGALEFCLAAAPRPLAVLNTHGHFDHVWSNDEISKTLGVPIYIHKDDAFLLQTDYFGIGMPLSRADFLVSDDGCFSAKGSSQTAPENTSANTSSAVKNTHAPAPTGASANSALGNTNASAPATAAKIFGSGGSSQNAAANTSGANQTAST
ncbi:MAG: MBL fold metallo-hydrolase, partial [Helicobacteraceae bacterium]